MSRSDNLSRIQELDKLIEKKAEQKEMLVKLMAKGYLEPALFNRESNELRMELDNYIEQRSFNSGCEWRTIKGSGSE